MFCEKCGLSIKDGSKQCEHCGHSVLKKDEKKSYLLYVLGVMAIVLIGGIALLWKTSAQDTMPNVVKGQLQALRSNKITEAYYEYTSKDFQSQVPLIAFHELVKAYGVLVHNNGLQLNSQQDKDGVIILDGVLTSINDGSIPISYELIKEDNDWKIHSISMKPPILASEQASAPDWLNPIDVQLRSLKNNDFEAAYNETSTEFRKATSLEDFKTFVGQYPILKSYRTYLVGSQSLKNNEADVVIVLDQDKEGTNIRYKLHREDGKWKIWNLNVVIPYTAAEKALVADPSSFTKTAKKIVQELRNGSIESVYNNDTANEFKKTVTLDVFKDFIKKYPLLINHEKAAFGEPAIEDGAGKIVVALSGKDGFDHFEFIMAIQNNGWKIWGIQEVVKNPALESSANLQEESKELKQEAKELKKESRELQKEAKELKKEEKKEAKELKREKKEKGSDNDEDDDEEDDDSEEDSE